MPLLPGARDSRRQAPPDSGAPATGSYDALSDGAVYDAVYEDLDPAGAPAAPAWQSVTEVEDPFAEASLAAPERVTASGDGHADPTGFDTAAGFKIGFDATPTVAIAPVRPARHLPAPAASVASPPPAEPPRV
jgi:hypothetical protein